MLKVNKHVKYNMFCRIAIKEFPDSKKCLQHRVWARWAAEADSSKYSEAGKKLCLLFCGKEEAIDGPRSGRACNRNRAWAASTGTSTSTSILGSKMRHIP